MQWPSGFYPVRKPNSDNQHGAHQQVTRWILATPDRQPRAVDTRHLQPNNPQLQQLYWLLCSLPTQQRDPRGHNPTSTPGVRYSNWTAVFTASNATDAASYQQCGQFHDGWYELTHHRLSNKWTQSRPNWILRRVTDGWTHVERNLSRIESIQPGR